MSGKQTPRFELSPKTIIAQYEKLKQVCDIVSYSSKTNPLVTPILEEHTDAMFSVHNQKELSRITDKTRVLYFGLAWSTELVRELESQGVSQFAVDNEKDFAILLSALTKSATIFLRLKLKERSIRSERYYVFGMSSKLVKDLIQRMLCSDLNHKIGIHVHRKTQNVNEWNIQDDIQEALGEMISQVSVLNIGGGLPAEYTNTNLNVIESVLQKVKQLHDWLASQNIALMTEPGRFICAPAVKLVTTILRIHDNTIVVNASVYNAYTDSVFGSQRLLVDGEKSRGEGEPFLIKGITPDSIDIFRYRVFLDAPKEGDELVFLNAGAYNFATEFCDLDKVETLIKHD